MYLVFTRIFLSLRLFCSLVCLTSEIRATNEGIPLNSRIYVILGGVCMTSKIHWKELFRSWTRVKLTVISSLSAGGHLEDTPPLRVSRLTRMNLACLQLVPVIMVSPILKSSLYIHTSLRANIAVEWLLLTLARKKFTTIDHLYIMLKSLSHHVVSSKACWTRSLLCYTLYIKY